jgi:hypothetical protein
MYEYVLGLFFLSNDEIDEDVKKHVHQIRSCISAEIVRLFKKEMRAKHNQWEGVVLRRLQTPFFIRTLCFS